MLNQEHPSDRRRRYLRYVAIILTVVLIVSAGFVVMEEWEKRTGVYNEHHQLQSNTLNHNGNEYTVKDNIETILVLGLDKASDVDSSSYNNSKQADFLMLFVLDNNANTCKAIQINRDTMAPVNVLGVAGDVVDTVTQQITLAHTYGNGKEVSCRNTANAVSKLLMNIEIDHFVSITLDAVPVLNDLVGGVSVEVMGDFSNIDESLVKGHTVTLTGDQALKYIQSRQGLDNETNNNRMERQRQYIKALYNQFCTMAEQNESFVTNSAVKITDYIISDCSANKLEGYLSKIPNCEFLGIAELEGQFKQGEYMEFYPDEESIKQTVIDTFYKQK